MIIKSKASVATDQAETKVQTITLAKTFDQILYLENLIQRQYNKHRDLVKFVQMTVQKKKNKGSGEDWATRFASFKATYPSIDHETKYIVTQAKKADPGQGGRFQNVTQIFDNQTKQAI